MKHTGQLLDIYSTMIQEKYNMKYSYYIWRCYMQNELSPSYYKKVFRNEGRFD